MRIGVVSDTHNNLPNVERIVELFNEARVDRVVHTGDITQARTLELFAHLDAPLFGVYGNNDERAELARAAAGLEMQLVEPPLELHWAGRQIVVVHDPLDLNGALTPRHHLALHGHNHRRVVERRAETLVVNPGESAGHINGHNAVGVIELARLEVEILRF